MQKPSTYNKRPLPQALMKRDSVACTFIYTSLAELYYKIGLYPQEKYYLERAEKWAPTYDAPLNKAIYYMTLSGISGSLQHTHIDLRALEKADSCYALSNNSPFRISSSLALAEGIISQRPDSIPRALALLNSLPHLYGAACDWAYDKIEVARALAFIKLGRETEARKVMLNMDAYKSDNYNVYLDTLVQYFLKREDVVMVAHLCKLREPLLAPYINTQNRNATIASDIKYKTREKDARLQQQNAQLKISALQQRYYGAIIGVMVLLLAGGVLYYCHRLRLHRLSALLTEQKRLTAEQTLQLTIQEHKAAEERLQVREQELKQATIDLQDAYQRAANMEKDLALLMVTPEATTKLAQITPKLLNVGEETRFRRIFAERHPLFITTLRSQIQGITSGEELLCMLIVLGQSSDEIAVTLCISRDSVNKSRYRLRKKTDLKRDDSLDEFLRQLLDSPSSSSC